MEQNARMMADPKTHCFFLQNITETMSRIQTLPECNTR